MAESNEASSWLDRLGEKIGTRARAETVYGEPIEREGITVIPVAKVRYGFGGGGGTEHEEGGEEGKEEKSGSGGGGGVNVSPLGYIEIKDGKSNFKRILDPMALGQILAGAGFSIWLVLRGLRTLNRPVS